MARRRAYSSHGSIGGRSMMHRRHVRHVSEGVYVSGEIRDELTYSLRGVRERAKDYRPLWKSYPVGYFRNPDIYDRVDRFLGKAARERHGKVINWSPGYSKHLLISRLKKALKVKSTRPYAPKWTNKFESQMAKETTAYLLEGVTP